MLDGKVAEGNPIFHRLFVPRTAAGHAVQLAGKRFAEVGCLGEICRFHIMFTRLVVIGKLDDFPKFEVHRFPFDRGEINFVDHFGVEEDQDVFLLAFLGTADAPHRLLELLQGGIVYRGTVVRVGAARTSFARVGKKTVLN